MKTPVEWPEGKRFAFTVFDDPDSQPLEESRIIYDFLHDIGLRTTMGIWPSGPYREGTSRSESCANPAYREHVMAVRERGFEIGFHGAALRSSEREQTRAALESFREYFGSWPSAMANHFDNAEAIYWGPARLGGLPRLIYKAATGKSRSGQYFGEIEGSKWFWGDLCRSHIRYCRGFVFREMNTFRVCPEMPYFDAQRPFVNAWYAGSEGADAGKYLKTISEVNQDRLEEEGGACIMYTHFGKGFVQDGRLNPRFRQLMERLSRRKGWFVPVTTLLDHIRSLRGEHNLSPAERTRLEWTWLLQKISGGTS